MLIGLSFLGWLEEGKPKGPCWRFLVGGTYIYGIVDDHGKFTGDDIAFIYQDLELALVGGFKNGMMVSLLYKNGVAMDQWINQWSLDLGSQHSRYKSSIALTFFSGTGKICQAVGQ